MSNEFKGPTFRYGPNGEAEIFHDSRKVPEGWLDHPEKHKNPNYPHPAPEPEPVDEDGLRTDGPTLAEYVAAGYPADSYPPEGYAAKEQEEAPPVVKPKPTRGGKPARLSADE